MGKRIIITTGGTGGHIFPAQGLADELRQHDPEIEILFVGGGLSNNRYFQRDTYPYREVSCSSFKNPSKLYKILVGVYESAQIISTFNPDLMIGFGSFNTFPPLIAAKYKGIPIILHEANSIPGKVNRWLAPFVSIVGVHFPDTISLIKGKAIEVGMPLRKLYKKGIDSRAAALAYFGFSDNKPILLVFGGSQGAEAINRLMKLTKIPNNLQILHLTGKSEATRELQSIYAAHGITAVVKTFEEHMHHAWAAADIFISRAGASTLAEAMEFEVPGLLIPYPHAADNHQEKNADFFVSQVKGGIMLNEGTQIESQFAAKLPELIDPQFRSDKSDNIRIYKKQNRPTTLCELVLKTIDK